jgi:hypothetical protein
MSPGHERMLQAMVVTKTGIATTIMVMAVTWGGVCLTGYPSIQAGPGVQAQTTLKDAHANLAEKDTGNKDAKKADKIFPDGLEHDFGRVASGTQVKYAFRVVNTSNVPLRIVSVRWS